MQQKYQRIDCKAWFSSVTLNYSHSLLHNIISNKCERSIFIALKIISQISVRVKRKRFVFNPMRLFYFKEKPTTPLPQGNKNMKKHTFQWKNVFVRRFLLKWKLLKHLWKLKKMGKTYTRQKQPVTDVLQNRYS